MTTEQLALDGALADLIALVHRYGEPNPTVDFSDIRLDRRLPEHVGEWTFPRLTPTFSRESAVLILFGALDDIPADHRKSRIPEELDILLTQRSLQLRKHPGQISFPGGGRDPEDTSATACALREAEEETGLDPQAVTVLGQLPTVGIPVSQFNVVPVVGWWTHPSEVAVVDANEATRVFRVPVADLVNPANRINVVNSVAGHQYRSPAFTVSNTLVWGFTAMLLDRLLDLLGWSEEWDYNRGFDVGGWDATKPVPVSRTLESKTSQNNR